MKRFLQFEALLLFALGAAQAQTICQNPATGPQEYSDTGTGVPQYVPGALNEFLGYIPKAYVALPGMPSSPLAFCGPTWTANYAYVIGNLIEPVTGGDVWQAIAYVDCVSGCTSGSTQPGLFSGIPFSTIFWPSPYGAWVSTCSDPGSIATCDTVSATGTPAPINSGEPYEGADVGATMVILDYVTPDYTGSWTITASTGSSPYTYSFTASGLGSGNCPSGQVPNCVTYQQGSQLTDHQILWQDVGPQNEIVTQAPDFTIAGVPASVSVSPGATTGNTSAITVTSVDGFTGSVTLTAAITSSPAGAQDLPTFSFSPSSSVNVTPGAPGTATLTIYTTAATGGALAYPARPGARWHSAGGTGLLAFTLLFGIGIPARRRSWRTRLGPLVFLTILAGGLLACGSVGGGGGTTPGTYTVTVTGTSGSTTATGTVTLTVQ
ncbi:MAG: hypothetical protein WCF61_01450 [Terriglobales bacterium]